MVHSCFIGHLKCVKELVKAGADIELCDDKNRPPERVICKWTYANDKVKDAIEELVHIKDDFDDDRDDINISDIDEEFFDKNDVNAYITRREKNLKKEKRRRFVIKKRSFFSNSRDHVNNAQYVEPGH
mgnify:CR=1 FL=1